MAQHFLARLPAYLNSQDGATLGVPYFLHHPIGSAPQLRDGHQVIGLYLKVLGEQKRENVKNQELALTSVSGDGKGSRKRRQPVIQTWAQLQVAPITSCCVTWVKSLSLFEPL